MRILATTAIVLAASFGTAQAATLTFEGFAANAAINSFSVDGITGTVVTNSNRPAGSGGTDQAVVFDTDNPTGNDDDLEAPFAHTGGTLGDLSPGEVLIIAGPDGGLGTPDDDARGGTITFNFDTLVDFLGFNFFDTEAGGNELVFSTDTGFVSGPLVAGNGLYDVFDTRLNGVRSVTFNLGGSGAIDNISFVSTVPVPAALPLLGFALGGLAFAARRRRKQG